MLVAEGAVDGAVDAVGVNEWDLAAVQVIVEEAGGRFSDFAAIRGRRRKGVSSNGCSTTSCSRPSRVRRLRPDPTARPSAGASVRVRRRALRASRRCREQRRERVREALRSLGLERRGDVVVVDPGRLEVAQERMRLVHALGQRLA